MFRKARPVPFARREVVAAELDRLEANRIITKVERSDWAAPTVNVLKPDKSVRICGHYKVTGNPHVDVDQYPLPTAEDIFSTLAGGVKFTKLDLAHAYNQLELDDASKRLLTINTHKGLYQPNRLSYGVNSAPAIFQRTIDQILAGIDGVACYLDDILITAQTQSLHLQRLDEVLSRLERYGIRLKLSKCRFMQDQIDYLGHTVSSEGLRPIVEKIAALKEAPTPTNVTELRSYLGLLKY